MKNSKGITLIALIITIIVMLILAGITISALLGEDGVITRANEGARKTEEKTIYENVIGLGYYFNDGVINLDKTWENIEEHYAEDVTLLSKDESLLKIKVEGKYGEYEYQIKGRGTELAIGNAYAILTKDGTMIFIRSDDTLIQEGKEHNGKIIEKVYKGFEEKGIPWEDDKARISSIIVEDIIIPKSISNWFSGMMACEYMNLGKLDTKNITTMKKIFDSLNVKKIDGLENWDVSKVEDMSEMFDDCSYLTSIGDISGWDVSGVKDMSSMFSDCDCLTSIGNISGWNVSSVTDMSYMFDECVNLINIGTLENWIVNNVSSMSHMFYNCDGIKVLNLSKWYYKNSGINVFKIINMDSMFLSCNNLESIGNISEWDVSSVTNMNAMFQGCNNLQDIGDISGWDVSKVTTMSFMFRGCGKLESVGDLYTNWDVSSVLSHSHSWFKNDDSNISVPNWVN